jgi:hypothetical protein
MFLLLIVRVALVLVVAIAVAGRTAPTAGALPPQADSEQIPIFEHDPSWPKPLPNNWGFGETWGIAVDSRDHPWVLQSTTHKDPAIRDLLAKEGKRLGPPVMEFDAQGNLVQAWGGPGPGYNWPEADSVAEHGLFIDHKDNVWVTGLNHLVLKFDRHGKFLLQIGEPSKTSGSNDRRLLGSPATAAVNRSTNEVYVADGYQNQRVVVFDADTGAYKRHWGAFGKSPDDGPAESLEAQGPSPQRFDIVHCVRVANDGLVYACDRNHKRFHVFRSDGTFVKEVFVDREVPAPWEWSMAKGAYVARKAPGVGTGSVSMIAFSPDPQQKYLYVGSAIAHRRLYIFRRSDLQFLGSFETLGGHHEMAVDSKGNIYTSDGRSRKPWRYLFKGVRPVKASR